MSGVSVIFIICRCQHFYFCMVVMVLYCSLYIHISIYSCIYTIYIHIFIWSLLLLLDSVFIVTLLTRSIQRAFSCSLILLVTSCLIYILFQIFRRLVRQNTGQNDSDQQRKTKHEPDFYKARTARGLRNSHSLVSSMNARTLKNMNGNDNSNSKRSNINNNTTSNNNDKNNTTNNNNDNNNTTNNNNDNNNTTDNNNDNNNNGTSKKSVS